MPAYQLTANGLWNNSAIWNPAAVPSSGDTANIGAFTVTIPDNYTAQIGATGQSTGYIALSVQNGGKLIIGSGVFGGATLNLFGDLIMSGTTEIFTMNGGSTLSFMSSPGQAIQANFYQNNIGCKGSINGTPSLRCKVITDPAYLSGGGSLCGFNVLNGTPLGLYYITNCDFIDNDYQSKPCISSQSASNASDIYISGNTFTRCSKVFVVMNNNTVNNFTYAYNRHYNTRGDAAYSLDTRFNTPLPQGAYRNIFGNYFDLSVNAGGWYGVSGQYNIFQNSLILSDIPWIFMDSSINVSYANGANNFTVSAPITNCYIAKGNQVPSNPHYLSSSFAFGHEYIDRCIFENIGNSAGDGDCCIENTLSFPSFSVFTTNNSNIVSGISTGFNFSNGIYNNTYTNNSLSGQWILFTHDLTATPYQVSYVFNNTLASLTTPFLGSTTNISGGTLPAIKVVFNNVTLNNGSSTATATGNLFKTYITDQTTPTPMWFRFSADPGTGIYQVQTVVDNNTLTLNKPYTGPSATGYIYPVLVMTAKNCLILKDAGGPNEAGVLGTISAYPNAFSYITHNTVMLSKYPGMAVAETLNGFPWMVRDFRANLFVATSGSLSPQAKEWNSGGSTINRGVQVPTPVAFTTNSVGGSITGNKIYSYRISALNTNLYECVPSGSQIISVPAGTDTNIIAVNWASNHQAVDATYLYKIYGRTSGNEQLLTVVQGPGNGILTWIDDGSITPSGNMVSADQTTTVMDKIHPSKADYCGGWNIAASSASRSWWPNQNNGYWDSYSSMPGVHDISGSPNFVDPNRGMATYWTSGLNNISTGSSTGDALSTLLYLSSNPPSSIPVFFSWVRQGFAPTNPIYAAYTFPGDTSTTDAAGNSWYQNTPNIGAITFLGSAPTQQNIYNFAGLFLNSFGLSIIQNGQVIY